MRLPAHAAAWLLCALLAGCASIGLTPAKSLTERISYAVGSTTALRLTASHALEAKQIEVKDAQYVLELTDQTRTLLDAARLASDAGDPKTAEGRLLLALNVLEQLERYLSQKVKT